MLLEHVGDAYDVDRPAGGVKLELFTFLVLAVEGEFSAVSEGAEPLGLLFAGAAGDNGLGDVVALKEDRIALGLFHGWQDIDYRKIVSWVAKKRGRLNCCLWQFIGV